MGIREHSVGPRGGFASDFDDDEVIQTRVDPLPPGRSGPPKPPPRRQVGAARPATATAAPSRNEPRPPTRVVGSSAGQVPRPATATSAMRKLPAFIPAETLVPTVQYRSMPTPPPSAPAAKAAPTVVERPAPRQPTEVMPLMAPMPPMPSMAPMPQRPAASGPGFDPRVVERTPRPELRSEPRQVVLVPQPGPQRRGQVTVVFGCRGGAGATTLAVNTAAQLARAGGSVCVVDLDLQLGDVFVALDLEPQTSLAAVAREAGSLDAVALRRRLALHASGIQALTQVGHPGELDGTLPGRLPALLAELTAHFDHVVVDGVRDFGDVALAVLDRADQVLLVVTQDVAAVRRAARAITLLRRLGVADGALRLVLNRARRSARIDEAAIERALATPLAARIRDDARRVQDALDDGALLVDVARGAGIAGDLDELAGLVRAGRAPRSHVATAITAPRRRSLLDVLRGRR